MMTKKVKGQKIKVGHMISLIAFFALVVVMGLMGDKEGRAVDLSFNFLNVIILFLVGVIASATMVIPGVSGSMVLYCLVFTTPLLHRLMILSVPLPPEILRGY